MAETGNTQNKPPEILIAISIGVAAGLLFAIVDMGFGGGAFGWRGAAAFGFLIFGITFLRVQMRKRAARKAKEGQGRD